MEGNLTILGNISRAAQPLRTYKYIYMHIYGYVYVDKYGYLQ